MGKIRKVCYVLLMAVLLAGTFLTIAEAKEKGKEKAKKKTEEKTEEKTKNKTCKSLCSSALQATGGGKYLKYVSENAVDFAALSVSARKKVKSIIYVCDDKEAYGLCVMKAKEDSDVKALIKAVTKYQKKNCASNYLSDYSAEEQRVFRNALYGKKGRYVWYIAMSAMKAKNKKGQTAIQKQL